jgi:hypothetical protein
MMMKKYLIIGKSPQTTDVYLSNDKGAFRQHRIIQGKRMEVTENQLNFYTERLVARKLIQIIELEGEVEEPTPIVLDESTPEPEEVLIIEETPAVVVTEIVSEEAIAPTPKKRRRRKKKVIKE